jgi:hypothetical protein
VTISRKPSTAERASVAVLVGGISILLGAAAWLSARPGDWVLTALLGLLSVVLACLALQIAVGAARELSRTEARAWGRAFVVVGTLGILFAALAPGAFVHRLMVAGGSMSILSLGLLEVRRPRP